MYYLYVLVSQKNKRHYIGIAKDANMRLKNHNAGDVTSTKAYIPWRIVHIEVYNTKVDAARRERKLKHHAWQRNELFKSL